MSKLGFYGWIRENVRRAVLLGFSDAVEQLGAPIEGEELHPQLVGVLRQPKPLLAGDESARPKPAPNQAGDESARPKPAPNQAGGRKRLGQTLDQIQERAAKPNAAA